MPHFEVQTSQLITAASRIDSAVSQAEQVAASNGRLSGEVAAAGAAAATKAIRSFLDTWTHGLNLMNADAHTLSGLLRSAAGKYEGAEDAIVAAEGG